MSKHRIFITLCLLLSLSCAWAQNNSQNLLRKFNISEYAIKSLYVDNVDEEKLVESAIVGMLKELDPHSVYISSKDVAAQNEPLVGNFDGVGIRFNMVNDTLFVIQAMADGPSERAGIMAGDRIIRVDSTNIAGVGMGSDEIKLLLKGPKGSEVSVGVVRRGVGHVMDFTLKRDKVSVNSIVAGYMLSPTVGYVKIDRFASTTYKEFMQIMSELQSAGMRDLVLDLQGNGGGFLNTAVDIVNEFLEEDQLIVYTEGRVNPRRDFKAKGNGKFKDVRLVVLIDEFSASASEILSGAIQDWDRGKIVGRRSFGKGLVQRPFELFDGSMLRITVARYYTPSGRCIQKPYESKEQYDRDLRERYNRGEMLSADSIQFPDSLKFQTLCLGRTVYGGGGIMPDVFVPVDTTEYTNYHVQLNNKGIISQIHYHYIDQYRSQWEMQYKDFDTFNSQFNLPQEMLNDLFKAGESQGIKPMSAEERTKTTSTIMIQLKALIARDLWSTSQYHQIMNQMNESVQKACTLLSTP